jgi:hypothetical protein
VCSGAHASSLLDCPLYLPETAIQKICVEEHLSFPEVRKRYFEEQPKSVRYICPGCCLLPSDIHISTQMDSIPPVHDTGGLKVSPYQPRLQPKSGDLPKQPQAHEPRKHFSVIQSPSELYYESVDGKCEGAYPTQSRPMRT